MKIANIYIKGQIGDSYNEDGTVAVKGVKLADVVLQMEANKGSDRYDVYINSNGGSIDIGRAIAKYIGSFANTFTIADTNCKSMGTEIHLSVPLERRAVISGTDYLIHNPLLVGVSGNAKELSEASDYIKTFEKEMLAMYHNATGLDKAALEGLMAQESSLTDEQLKSLGFVSLIIPKAELKAVAFIDNKNQQTEIMTKVKTWIAEGFATLRKELKLPVAEVKTDAKAEVLTDANGISIYTDKPIADFVTDQNTGIKVFSDEAMTVPMVDGEFEANGYKITVAGGMVTAVETSMTPEEEMALLKAENEALKQENANARAEFEAALTEQIENLKADIGSAYVPKGEVKRFVTTKQTTAPVATVKKSVKEEVAERKAQYKTTKK